MDALRSPVCWLLLAALLAGACGGGGSPGATATSSTAPLSQAALKYRIVDEIGRPLFCDPDFYPVARADEGEQARQRFPEMQQDIATFAAMVSRLRLSPSGPFTPEQQLVIYREWKMLNALRLEPSATAAQRFQIRVVSGGATPTGARTGAIELVEGAIDPFGKIAVLNRIASGLPICPICLARGTPIATPAGERAVEELHLGDTVWTQAADGARVAAPVVLIATTPVPLTHEVVHLVLSDGREVFVSPGHPSAEGRFVGDLRTGEAFDGARVVGTARVPYKGGATFDLLPAGPTGTYWANGVLLGSTLGR